jgi:hypothetical protein
MAKKKGKGSAQNTRKPDYSSAPAGKPRPDKASGIRVSGYNFNPPQQKGTY